MISRELWYRRPDVLFQIIKACRDREIAFLGEGIGVRNVFAQHSGLLKRNFDAFRFFSRDLNLYYSLATVIDIHMFSFSPKARKEESQVWNRTFPDHWTGLDLGLDFDAPDVNSWRMAWKDAGKVKSSLDAFNVPYSLKFSGGGGFHIRIPFSAMPEHLLLSLDNEELDSVLVFVKSVGELLKDFLKLQSLDIGVFDERRLWKADYSIAVGSGLVALPLTDKQFAGFSLDMCAPETVLKSGVYNRGLLWREGSRRGFLEFCDEILGFSFLDGNN